MKYLKFSQNILKVLLLTAILYWPLMRYQFNLDDIAAPDLWLIFLFIFVNDYQYNQWQLFLLSLILDNLYSLPNGTNYIAITLATYIYKLISAKITKPNSLFKLIDFSVFAFIVYIFRFIVLVKQSPLSNVWLEVLFGYLFTTLAFPIIDTLKYYFFDNVK